MKTQLDLFESASKFAADTLSGSSSYQQAEQGLDRFNSEKQDPADWDLWCSMVQGHRERLRGLASLRAPSQVAADAAAAAAAKPAAS